MSRAQTLERLESETFDLIVIGAGIIGARVAYEAAVAGAAVALIDAHDFGSATSSASSKLIHGGLRYLRMFDFDLVHEAHLERRALLDRVAPHLVRPLTFVLPVYRGGLRAIAMIEAAMLTYAVLSGFRHSQNRLVGPRTARRLVPDLNTQGMKAAGVFSGVSLSDEDKAAYLPDAIQEVLYRLRYPQPLGRWTLFSMASLQHGAQRRRQGFPSPALVEEARALQVVLFEVVERNMDRVDLGQVPPTLMAIADEVNAQLLQSLSGYENEKPGQFVEDPSWGSGTR